MSPGGPAAAFGLLLLAAAVRSPAAPPPAPPRAGAVALFDETGARVTLSRALGDGYKVLLVTKPWVEANGPLLADLVHYRIRLNRGSLRSAVVFLRSEPAAALKSLGVAAGKVRALFDPEGDLARALAVRTMPALVLVDPEGTARFAAPLLSREMVRQIAQNYARKERLFAAPRPAASPRPGIPAAGGGIGRYSIR